MKFAVYLLAIIALLGGMFVYFRPQPPNPVATPKTSQPEMPVAAGAPVAPVAAPGAASVASEAAAPVTPQVAASAPPPATDFDIVIRKGRLVAGPTVIQVHQGDLVTMRFTSDAADEIHVHGYDLHARMRPGETTTLQFSAKRTGRFGYELHHAKAELGALEVYPR